MSNAVDETVKKLQFGSLPEPQCQTCEGFREQIEDLREQIASTQGDLANAQAVNNPGQIAGYQKRLKELYAECGHAVENYHRHIQSAHKP